MNADEAKREQVRILTNRLKAWGVDDALKKAQMFMDDLRLAGWHWDAPINRPIPPKRDEACLTCGRHIGGCICGEQRTRPIAVDPEVAKKGAALARELLSHPQHEATDTEEASL